MSVQPIVDEFLLDQTNRATSTLIKKQTDKTKRQTVIYCELLQFSYKFSSNGAHC